MFGEGTDWENNKNRIFPSPEAPYLITEDA